MRPGTIGYQGVLPLARDVASLSVITPKLPVNKNKGNQIPNLEHFS